MIRLLVMLGLLGAGAFAQADERRVRTKDADDLELIQALDDLIPRWLRVEEVPGLNIALARRGAIVWEGAYGYADAKARRSMTTDTVFHSGSIAKPYASVAIMQLAERGALKLDDPIEKYLPFKVDNPLGGPPITVHHLLTHRSGLGGDSAASYLCERANTVRPLAELVAMAYRYQYAQAPVGTGPHRFHQMWTQPVGAQYQYSNLGVATLGVIVERANPERLSYSEYVQKKIMDPLGMRYAQMPPAQIRELIRPDIWERMSTGYQVMGGAWVPTAQVCFGEFPCGGSVATPADYLRLLMAMMRGGRLGEAGILGSEAVQASLHPQFAVSSTQHQGLIWRLWNWDTPHAAFGHAGGHMFGWQTMSKAYPAVAETAFVVAENTWTPMSNRSAVDRVTDFIDGWLKTETPAARAELRRNTLAKLAESAPKPIAPPSVANLDWKLSYLRGLLFADSYYQGIETPERLTKAQVEDLARRTATDVLRDAHWDSSAFIAGVMDMATVQPSVQAVRGFAASTRMRISLAEAQALYRLLDFGVGGRTALGDLLWTRASTLR